MTSTSSTVEESKADALAATILPDPTSKDRAQQEHAALLNVIDKLRFQGISDHVDLPQLIVCGSQSSGKSSVLEAITRLKFPIQDGMCTLFATELTLRRSETSEVIVRINPATTRSEAEKERLHKFSHTLNTSSGFPEVVEKATKLMQEASNDPDNLFFDDILRIEITGPERPELTIVDLPGLIHNDKVRGKNIEKVRTMVGHYTKNDRSIVLAIVDATANEQLQEVLQIIDDEEGNMKSRTLGIITKLDKLHDNSGEQKRYLLMAKNQSNTLKHRWHILKNRDFPEKDISDDDRDKSEREFFSKGVWKSIDEADKGIDSLRPKLSKILLQQITRELPKVIREIRTQIDDCEAELTKLGKPRSTMMEQRLYLCEIGEKYHNIVNDAIHGRYNVHAFFKPWEGDAKVEKRPKNLRAILQRMNTEYSEAMFRKGVSWTWQKPEPGSLSAFEEKVQIPDSLEMDKIYNKIGKMLEDDRGVGLPNSPPQPAHIESIFQELSVKWKGIAAAHVTEVVTVVKEFLQHVFRYIIEDVEYSNKLFYEIDNVMTQKEEALRVKLDELLAPHISWHPITYDVKYREDAITAQAGNMKADFANKLAAQYPDMDYSQASIKDAGEREIRGKIKDIANLLEDNIMENRKKRCNEVLWAAFAYYDLARSRFVDNVACLAIEQCLIRELPKFLSVATVREMDDKKIYQLVAEDEEVLKRRGQLERKLALLTEGFRTVKDQALTSNEARVAIFENLSPMKSQNGRLRPGSTGLPTPSPSPSPSPLRNGYD